MKLPFNNCKCEFCPFMIGFDVHWFKEDGEKAVRKMLIEMYRSGKRVLKTAKEAK